MKKTLALIFASALALTLLTLGGCEKSAPDPAADAGGQNVTEPAGEPEAAPIIEDDFPPDGQQEPLPAPSEDDPPEPVGVADCSLRFKGAQERSDGDYSKVYEINCGGEYVESSYVWCDAEMTDFECISIEMYDDEATTFTRTGVYSHINSVKPGEAVYVTIELPEIIPNAAFVYTAEGTRYIQLIGYNGRDGGMSLSPLEPDKLLDAE